MRHAPALFAALLAICPRPALAWDQVYATVGLTLTPGPGFPLGLTTRLVGSYAPTSTVSPDLGGYLELAAPGFHTLSAAVVARVGVVAIEETSGVGYGYLPTAGARADAGFVLRTNGPPAARLGGDLSYSVVGFELVDDLALRPDATHSAAGLPLPETPGNPTHTFDPARRAPPHQIGMAATVGLPLVPIEFLLRETGE